MLQFLQQLLDHTFLNPASPQTRAVSNLFWVGGAVATVILAIPTGVLLYTITRYRHKPDQQGEPHQVYGFARLEIAWTVIPTIIVLVIFGLSIHTQGLAEPNTDPGPSGRSDLTVIGHQWWWELRYPSGVVSANEIHIPVRTRWLVSLKSADVVHGFWVPRVGNQIYLIPGQTNHIWLEADKPGVYEGQCAEFCGAQHAWMLLRVIAQPQAVFDRWQRDQSRRAPAPTGRARSAPPPATGAGNTIARFEQPATGAGVTQASLVASGAQLFQQLPCQSCHAIAGTRANAGIGPDLTHLASRATLAAGRLDNTPANLRDWLRDPQKYKEGSHMPSLLLTPNQIDALTAYLESLK
jgi:cytochrome c oxidase subunit 2